jgi:hypothetical protein
MKVRFTKDCFMDSAIRPAGSTYNLPARVKFNPKIMVLAPMEDPDEVVAKPVAWDEGPTKKEMMAQLDAAGIKYKPMGNKAYLKGLLDEAQPPGTSQAPSKDPFDSGIPD